MHTTAVTDRDWMFLLRDAVLGQSKVVARTIESVLETIFFISGTYQINRML